MESRPAVAVELVAAARRLAADVAIELLEESRDRGHAIEAQARATVGDAAVEDALAHGQRLGWRDAIGVALAGLRG